MVGSLARKAPLFLQRLHALRLGGHCLAGIGLQLVDDALPVGIALGGGPSGAGSVAAPVRQAGDGSEAQRAHDDADQRQLRQAGSAAVHVGSGAGGALIFWVVLPAM